MVLKTAVLYVGVLETSAKRQRDVTNPAARVIVMRIDVASN